MEGGAILPNALGNKTMPGGMPGIQWGQQIYHINNNSCCLLHIWAYCQESGAEGGSQRVENWEKTVQSCFVASTSILTLYYI